jgi:hypothetical protein
MNKTVSGTLTLSKEEIKNHMPIEIMYKLAHASKSIHSADSAVTKSIYGFQPNSDSLDINDCLD